MRRCITTLVKVYSRQCLLRLPSFRRRANTYVFLQPSFCLESHVSFNSRPNVRGTLVAVEKAASNSVSFVSIIVWGARSRFKALQAHLAELLGSQQLMFSISLCHTEMQRRFTLHFQSQSIIFRTSKLLSVSEDVQLLYHRRSGRPPERRSTHSHGLHVRTISHRGEFQIYFR